MESNYTTTEFKTIAIMAYKNGQLVKKMFFDNSGLYVEDENDILEHDEDGYFIIYN